MSTFDKVCLRTMFVFFLIYAFVAAPMIGDYYKGRKVEPSDSGKLTSNNVVIGTGGNPPLLTERAKNDRDHAIIEKDETCGWWVMDGDGHGGRWDHDTKRVESKFYRGDKMPRSGNFSLHHVDPSCLILTPAQLEARGRKKAAERRAEFDREWETVSEDQCSGHYRHRTNGSSMSSSWCLGFVPVQP